MKQNKIRINKTSIKRLFKNKNKKIKNKYQIFMIMFIIILE